MIKTKYLLSLSLFFGSIFSLSALQLAPDFSEKAHFGVYSENTSISHLDDQSKSIELHQVTKGNFQYDALGSTVCPGRGIFGQKEVTIYGFIGQVGYESNPTISKSRLSRAKDSARFGVRGCYVDPFTHNTYIGVRILDSKIDQFLSEAPINSGRSLYADYEGLVKKPYVEESFVKYKRIENAKQREIESLEKSGAMVYNRYFGEFGILIVHPTLSKVNVFNF